MNLLVDTSVWSLALRRDQPPSDPAVERLANALDQGEGVFVTGLLLQEILQRVRGPRAAERIVHTLSKLGGIAPTLDDRRAAAGIRKECRCRGIRIGTIGALIAQLAVEHSMSLLRTGRDFQAMSKVVQLRLAVDPA